MKKFVALILSIFMAFGAFAACAKQAEEAPTVKPEVQQDQEPVVAEPVKEEPDKPKEMTIWVDKLFYDQSNEMLAERIQQFGEENGIKMNVEMIANADMMTKWTAAIESKNFPDMITIGSQDLGAFINQGLMADLSDLFEQIEADNGSIFPNLADVCKTDGKVYGIPRSANAHTMIYRTDLLEAAGYSEPPATWEEYRTYCKAMTNASEGVYGAGIGFGPADSDAEWFSRYLLLGYGASVISEDGKSCNLNTPEAIEAIQLIVDIMQLDKSAPASASNWDDKSNNTAYLSGQVATAFNAASLLLAARDSETVSAVSAIAPVPAGPAGRYVVGSCMTYGVFAGAPNAEWSKKLIAYIMDYDWYSEWCETCAPLQGPSYEALADTSAWTDIPENKVIMETIKSAVFLGYPGPSTAEAGIIYNNRYMNELFGNILVSGMSVEEAVAEMTDKINAEVFGK